MVRFGNFLIPTDVGKLHLPNIIYNASGPRCTTYDELDIISNDLYTGAVLSKSCTYEKRLGNEEPRVYLPKGGDSLISINSTGLANNGYEYYTKYNAVNKPYIVSVADDNINIIRDINNNPNNISAIELNLSCPNIEGKSIIGYCAASTDEFLRKIFEEGFTSIGLKLPLYLNTADIGTFSDIYKKYPIDFLTCCNSPPGIIVQNFSTVIKPQEGIGGMGGDCVKPFSMMNVKKFYKEVGGKIDIIGCGGVKTGEDILNYVLLGASAVQVGTTFLKEGCVCFERLTKELNEIVVNNNIDIHKIKGGIKIL